jgi:hypothetical protein
MTTPLDADSEPFMLKKRSDEEVADYDKGFEAGQNDPNAPDRGEAA